MSFWINPLNNGKKITGSEDDSFAPSGFTIIPDGTRSLAMIKEFAVKSFNDDNFYQIVWKIVDGEFKGHEVRQKIAAFDASPQKKARALNMLMRVFMLSNEKPTHNNAPDDADLRPMHGKVHGIVINEWSMTRADGSIQEGNWVSQVHDSSGFEEAIGVRSTKEPVRSIVDSAFSRNEPIKPNLNGDFLSDDIPF